MRIKAIYDNGGETLDRYTVVFDSSRIDYRYNGYTLAYDCLCLSDNPEHPTGVSMWGECNIGKHLGKKITLKSLPKHIQEHIAMRRAE